MCTVQNTKCSSAEIQKNKAMVLTVECHLILYSEILIQPIIKSTLNAIRDVKQVSQKRIDSV